MVTQPSIWEVSPEVEQLRDHLRRYYGRHLKKSSDLSQKACCTEETEKRHAEILELIPEEVKQRHYGCGCPIPDDELSGLTVLDLGSGAGVDAFIMARKVGPGGFRPRHRHDRRTARDRRPIRSRGGPPVWLSWPEYGLPQGLHRSS